MRFRAVVRDDRGDEWNEDYDEQVTDPELYLKKLVENFNATLRPHERPRTLVRVEVLDRDNEKFHDWYKQTDGMSVPFRGSIVDLMRCAKCGITGKRYGLSGAVKIDSKYRKKVYRRCDMAIAAAIRERGRRGR